MKIVKYTIAILIKAVIAGFILSIGCSSPTGHNKIPTPPEQIYYSDAYPSYSPNGRYLVYDHAGVDSSEMFRFGQFSIWVYDLRLGRYGFLVGPGMFPRWSPDGSIVAFNWGNEIFFYYLATQTVRQVTHLGREIYTFRFTPDGTRMCATYSDILLIDTTGHISTIIRPHNGNNAGWGVGSDANWSASAESILVTGSFTRGIWGTILIDSSGLLLNSIIVPQTELEEISYTAWSPHRNKFVANFATIVNNIGYDDLRIYRMDGSVEAIISSVGGMGAWSPDGTQIAFQKYTWMGDNPDPQGIDYSRITIWVCDSYGRFAYELMGWPQQGYDSTMFGGGYNWLTDTHAP